MGNWKQLVEFTGEYTPGPYLIRFEHDSEGMIAELHARVRKGFIACVMPSPSGHFAGPSDHRGPSIWCDPEQEATARLMADAPELLRVLAAAVNLLDAIKPVELAYLPSMINVAEEAKTIMTRHVRIGFERESREAALLAALVEAADGAPRSEQPNLPGME